MDKPTHPPIHPGEILLEDFLRPMGISQSHLALAIRVPLQRVHDIVHGRRAISVDSAARLGRFFGTSADLWLNLQTHYDLEKGPRRRPVRPRAARCAAVGAWFA